jgi:ribosomal-protein-alanine N-acetyltransferase
VTDPPWTLRPLRWWDIERLWPLERELFPYDAWPVEAFWAELAMEESRVYLVAEDRGGSLLGYAGLGCPRRARGGDAEIMTMAVAPAAQGRGLGLALVAALRAEA